MDLFNRRKFLEGSAGVAAAATIGTGAAVMAPAVHAQSLSFKPEKGAKLRVLRWSRFVQGDIDAYMVNVKKFIEKTGIEVRVDNEGWEDVRPKAAVAANTGAGPDIILSTNDDANLYPTSWSTSPTCASTSAKSMAAGTRPARLICARTARSGSACRWVRPVGRWSTARAS